MKHRIFLIICLVCLLFSGCDIPEIPVDSESNIEVPVNNEYNIEVPTDNESNIDVDMPVADDSDIIAASGSADDIQAAADAVYAAGGGTVQIPEGEYELGGSVLIRDHVSLIGAGVGRTILRTEGAYMWVEAEGNNTRVSGFTLISSGYPGTDVQWGHQGVHIGNCIDFRVDHLEIIGYAAAGVYVRGIDARGVIDHCEITMKVVTNGGYGVAVYRDDLWEEDMELGSAEATFIEDCVIMNARHAIMANNGGHYVFRHNLVKQGVISHQVDAHGAYWGSVEGARCVEVYDNVIEEPVDFTLAAITMRGGGGVIFNNTTSGYEYPVRLIIEDYQDMSSYPVYHQVHDMWIWDNSHDGLADLSVPSYRMSDVFIQENRDYFLYAKPGYTPYTYPHPLVHNNSS